MSFMNLKTQICSSYEVSLNIKLLDKIVKIFTRQFKKKRQKHLQKLGVKMCLLTKQSSCFKQVCSVLLILFSFLNHFNCFPMTPIQFLKVISILLNPWFDRSEGMILKLLNLKLLRVSLAQAGLVVRHLLQSLQFWFIREMCSPNYG